MSKSVEYRTWQSIRRRCYEEQILGYENYGGRGIKVCDRWLVSFASFYEDMGPRPSKGHSIDRIDTNGDYSPENCRWATRKEQNNNARSNRMITYNGKTQNVSRWTDELSISKNTILNRLNLGWSVDKIFTTPVMERKMPSKLECKGKTQTFKEWSTETGLSVATIKHRLKVGFSIEEALFTPLMRIRA